MTFDRRTVMALAAAGMAGTAFGQTPPPGSNVPVPRGLYQPTETIDLWPDGAPGAPAKPLVETVNERSTDAQLTDRAVFGISRPRMVVFRPSQPNGAAVLITPGGGYRWVVVDKEGYEMGRWLAARGYTVFVLFYRLPGEGWAAGPDVGLSDAQRAMRIIRTKATEFRLDPKQIGVMGFSAGGHLAGFTAYQPERQLYIGSDTYEKVSARPDFAALLFPVVSLRRPYDTTRSRREIIGDNPSTEAEIAWSLDTYASADAPPTIIFASADDKTAPPGHGIMLFEKLNAAGASAAGVHL